MSRPRLSIGTFGDVTTRATPSGRFEARARYRDWDGHARQVSVNGDIAKAAERALKEKLAERSLFQPASTTLTPDSPFPDLVAYWLADIDQEDRISKTTRFLYERNMRTLVLPVFESLTLREIGVARCDQFIKMLAQQSYNRAKQARVVLRLALELAVRHEVLPRNPMDHVARLHREARLPDALTSREVNAIRAVIGRWESGIDHTSGPKPDGQLGAIVEIMLGTSARIGEALAIRRRDVDVTGSTPTIRIAGTIISQKGEVTFRQDHPKTAKSRRIVALPSFTAEAVRRRLAVSRDHEPDALLFQSRDGTPLTTANVRRQMRQVLERGGIAGITPRRDVLANLATTTWIGRAENVVLLGPSGVGKTHLGAGLGIKAAHAGYPVLFDTATAWVSRLQGAHREGRLEHELKRLRRSRLLFIDEVGYLHFDANAANLFFQLVAPRYEQGSILVTSNMPFGRWGEISSDDIVAAAMIDHRLIHHDEVVTLAGDSYRTRARRELLKTPPTRARTCNNNPRGVKIRTTKRGQNSANIDSGNGGA